MPPWPLAVRPAERLLLLSAAVALQVASSAADAGVCNEGSSDSCHAPSAGARASGPLRWRIKSYHEGRKERVYGGEHATSAIHSRFEGPVEGDDWDMLWSTSFEIAELMKRKLPARPGRLVNKCRFFRGAGQKCYFAGHVRRVDAALQKEGKRFAHLRNYVLNHKEQWNQWREEALAYPDRPWVLKECSSGMSVGVTLLRGKDLVLRAKGEPPKLWTVAQEYLERPYMGFGGRKFHLRVYAVVTHWGPPPRVYIFNEGVVFRSRSKYQHKKLSQDRDIFSALSSQTEAYTHGHFWQHLDDSGVSSAQVKARMLEQMGQLFGTALLEQPQEREDRLKETRPEEVGFQCWDLFGLDVMLDEHLNPFILEVNMGPNLNIDDRGEDSEDLLVGVKGPLVDQLVRWMELYVLGARAFAAGESESFDPEAAENSTFVGFTRVL